ncbi:duf409 domain containing protein [Grosmannia clavigera kw1407]|uniref:GPI mannosyltransferase 2 n=1 Tax=Grosmannia clavigera (strain kw1407 / UAMH 11150) TaxID=655863 RepID=F0X9L9_GROCL|nr:duf409 domain containing protein [Grosmannia clavigera kw1407]EFX06078.1 duf409 domain containing protein [Grosmannia clavigera kw1407]
MAVGARPQRAPDDGRTAKQVSGTVQRPYRSLIAAFCSWKAVLLLIAAVTSYGSLAYDTSASLASANHQGANGHDLATRLSSWDAVYFVQTARRGYSFEQEWAFGSGLPLLVSLLHKGFASLGVTSNISVPILAIAVSHVAHLLSVLVLYKLGRLIWLGDAGRRAAFIAACLHILSPAGLFLSAPYAESSFSFLSFAGHLIYATGCLRDQTDALPSFGGDVFRLLAGLTYGLASIFRTNGLLNGVPFAYEAVMGTVGMTRRPSWQLFRRLCFLGAGGLAVAAGSIIPQTVAYLQYCSEPSGIPGEHLRPWCLRTVPSIYGFVQGHYWNTGLFKYWTVSNIPLFLLAAPMLSILTLSAKDIWSDTDGPRSAPVEMKRPDFDGLPDGGDVQPKLIQMVRCLAVAQLFLAGLAFTSYHVQPITRLCSGYPVWYWWLARNLVGGTQAQEGLAVKIVCFMIMTKNTGQPDHTRFFMLKSFNEGNVRRAMADGVWTTQLKNEELLVTAFKKCRNVVFFFSVNKSRAFQGYARMESLPSASIVKPSWMDNIHWQTTEPFRIAWYNTTTTDYRHVAHLENDLNEHRSVIIGKDGQEIDDECGRRLMEELDVTADGEAAGSAAGRDRPDRFRTSPSLASRVTSGRP